MWFRLGKRQTILHFFITITLFTGAYSIIVTPESHGGHVIPLVIMSFTAANSLTVLVTSFRSGTRPKPKPKPKPENLKTIYRRTLDPLAAGPAKPYPFGTLMEQMAEVRRRAVVAREKAAAMGARVGAEVRRRTILFQPEEGGTLPRWRDSLAPKVLRKTWAPGAFTWWGAEARRVEEGDAGFGGQRGIELGSWSSAPSLAGTAGTRERAGSDATGNGSNPFTFTERERKRYRESQFSVGSDTESRTPTPTPTGPVPHNTFADLPLDNNGFTDIPLESRPASPARSYNPFTDVPLDKRPASPTGNYGPYARGASSHTGRYGPSESRSPSPTGSYVPIVRPYRPGEVRRDPKTGREFLVV
ncbi:hypothetical protein BZA05DRAFT_421615 [Tricharina praecox]|uniref:uncharacterized protein n=1 Tax=Tricharina praecox TaxID=43433 RepID=UPI00221E5381|nr:uncharacterized protein BZA05DRAFT_421615 [Tricharina praecox]KAI5844680.1 hypothetical protein BZA05DRAFT_421615 [Tricharina praecox]